MSKEELFNRADELKKEGVLLLKESGIIEFLAQYGQVKISGSYRLNLMANGDIDLYVIPTEFSKETATAILNKLIEQDFFIGYYYGDYIKNPRDGFPRGYYIGLNTTRNGTFVATHRNDSFWKIDIWLIKDEHEIQERENFMNFIEANLTEESKYEILMLKQERSEKKLNILSIDIYKQVLDK